MRELYKKISERWNRCERLLKTAERVRGEVLNPSINELRYAGRRFVDAISLLSEENLSVENRAKADSYLNEAFMFCMQAEHDCVDAVVMHAHLLIEQYSTEYGQMLLIQACPSLEKYRMIKPQIDALILSSREERDRRNDLYHEIIDKHIETMIDIVCSVELSEPLIKEEMARRKRERIINYSIGLIGAFLSIVGIALSL